MARMVNRCACTLTPRRSSLLTIRHSRCRLRSSDVSLPTSLLQLQSHNQCLAIRFVFLRRLAILPTVLGVSRQTNDSIDVPQLPMNIQGVPPHTFNSFGVPPQESIFGIPPAPNTSSYTSSSASRRHLHLGVLPPPSTCHQPNRTMPSPDFSRFI